MSAMNKDEAQRCINIAKRAIADGDILKATKFLNKSIALCPLDVAKGREYILLTTNHPRAVRPTYFIEAVINTQRTNTLNFEFFDAVFWKSTN